MKIAGNNYYFFTDTAVTGSVTYYGSNPIGQINIPQEVNPRPVELRWDVEDAINWYAEYVKDTKKPKEDEDTGKEFWE